MPRLLRYRGNWRAGSWLLPKVERIVYGVERPLEVLFCNKARHFNFRCADDLNVNAFCSKCLKHVRSDAGAAHHAGTDDRNLGDMLVVLRQWRAEFLGELSHQPLGTWQVISLRTKYEVGLFARSC